MGDAVVTALTMENHQPSTLLSMDSSASLTHDELDLEISRKVGFVMTRPPDINLPLLAEISPPQLWNPDCGDIVDDGLGNQICERESFFSVQKIGRRKNAKRVDGIWGAWFFFSFYFKPTLNDKSKARVIGDGNGLSGFDKSDLQLDTFMVQHDMENMYMWVFKERPDNALSKMQLQNYMNGHSRQGERPFPFSVDRGFVRSHRMQRKHYRGLSNPQCVHGLEVVPAPYLGGIDDDDRRRWMELTGRELNFSIPPEASDYGSWRNSSHTEFELDKTSAQVKGHKLSHTKKLFNGSVLNLLTQLTNSSNGDVIDHYPPVSNKRKRDFFTCGNGGDFGMPERAPDQISDSEGHQNGFSGVIKNAYGPVTAAKTTYEDEEGYLVLLSLPFVDRGGVKVTWRNTLTHGIIKVSCTSTSCTPFIKRHNRTFKLMDTSSEHCPPGEFIREIPLSTRIPQDAIIEAYYDGPGSVLEILVPKLSQGAEEHEVRVCLRPVLSPSPSWGQQQPCLDLKSVQGVRCRV